MCGVSQSRQYDSWGGSSCGEGSASYRCGEVSLGGGCVGGGIVVVAATSPARQGRAGSGGLRDL